MISDQAASGAWKKVTVSALSSGFPGGASGQVQYNNGGVFGGLTATLNGVLVTNGAGSPSISTTLPNGIAMGNSSLNYPDERNGPASFDRDNRARFRHCYVSGDAFQRQPARVSDR